MIGNSDSQGLHLFKQTGFFDERDLALQHLRDADEILTVSGADYCIMFGTLLGLLRHEDLIPWDDDLDIIVFDLERFEASCRHQFEKRGYGVFDDIRVIDGKEKRCGYRVYSEQGQPVPGKSWKFPWMGVWEPEFCADAMTLLPEQFVYAREDFFPLQRSPFLDFEISIPSRPEKIVRQYYGEDCMTHCVLHHLEHRHYRPTGFPTTKFPLVDVMACLGQKP